LAPGTILHEWGWLHRIINSLIYPSESCQILNNVRELFGFGLMRIDPFETKTYVAFSFPATSTFDLLKYFSNYSYRLVVTSPSNMNSLRRSTTELMKGK